MRSEPLDIDDKKFLINRLIQQAPTNTIIREFFKNCDENAALAPFGEREVRIYPVLVGGVRKLAFWNSGIGMDDEELKRATNLSASINKEMALDGNFGIGAKVSGLTMSSNGIRYRSCKNGEVNEITIGFDEDMETYCRFTVHLPDNSYDTVCDVTEVLKNEGVSLTKDWTEVVLFGESENHDTVAEPLGKRTKRLDRSFVTTQIFRRFESFSPGVEVHIDVAMTKGGGKQETGRYRKLRTLTELLDRLPRHETVVDPDDGISVRYIHDPKHEKSGHTHSSRLNPATGSTTFCAIVHKGERYDFKTGKSWSAAAPNFGVPFGSKVLTIEILISDKMALANQYRDALTWPSNRALMVAEDFSDYVREFMPDWVKEVIRAESPEASENLDDLQSELQKLLDDFRVPTLTRSLSREKDVDPSEFDTEGTNLDDNSGLDTDEDELDPIDDKEKVSGSIKRAVSKKIRKAPDGAKASKSSRALELVPEIQILDDPDQIEEKSLSGRAGCYYKDVRTLFINGLYLVADRMALDLERDLAGECEPELLRKFALNAARYFMAYRVGKTVCYAISKRLIDNWTNDDLERATSPESLTMAADDYQQSIVSARKWVRKQIKSEQADAA